MKTLDGFGLAGMDAGIGAAGAVFEYLRETQKSGLVASPADPEGSSPPRGSSSTGAPSEAWSSCARSARARWRGRFSGSWTALRRPWALGSCGSGSLSPLVDVAAIDDRLDAVAAFLEKGEVRARSAQTPFGHQRPRAHRHAPRLRDRQATGPCRPRDDRRGAAGHQAVARPAFRRASGARRRRDRYARLHARAHPFRNRRRTPPPTPATAASSAQATTRSSTSSARISRDGRSWIAEYQRQEIERTGIESLRVAYNRVFGYYIHITNSQSDKVPSNYIRKQTLKNAERYVTPELREYESQVLSAQERSAGARVPDLQRGRADACRAGFAPAAHRGGARARGRPVGAWPRPPRSAAGRAPRWTRHAR